jgi:hypothetical protein
MRLRPGRKIGAPPKRDPEPGERFQIGVRVTPDLKRRLDAAAEDSGRSQSQEAELRLERSFDREDLLTEVLTMSFDSKQLSGLLIMLGMVMVEAGGQAAYRILGEKPQAYGLISDVAFWLANPKVCDIAIEAAITVLESIRPKGPPPWVDAGFGACVANNIIQTLREEKDSPIQNLVGPIATRMREIPPAELRAKLEDLAKRLARPVESISYSKPADEEETRQSSIASMFAIRRRA